MVDVWLIFAQTIPFIEVLLHTIMDYLRDDEEREINHHGKAMNVEEKGKEEKDISISKVAPYNHETGQNLRVRKKTIKNSYVRTFLDLFIFYLLY